jgi:hypothetical protein
VRVVTLVGTPDRRDGTWLRVTQFGAWTADVGSVAELERFFPLSDLEPDDGRLAAEARLGGRRALVGERGPGDMAPPSAASRCALRPTAAASDSTACAVAMTAARRTHPCLCPS